MLDTNGSMVDNKWIGEGEGGGGGGLSKLGTGNGRGAGALQRKSNGFDSSYIKRITR